LPLLERIRIEIYIPDLPDIVYKNILEELGDELSYSFGGCSVVAASGKYRSDFGSIIPDRVNILFTDTPFHWDRDRLIVELYAERLKEIVTTALSKEEAILITVSPIYHA
jgi:hypothetical protein